LAARPLERFHIACVDRGIGEPLLTLRKSATPVRNRTYVPASRATAGRLEVVERVANVDERLEQLERQIDALVGVFLAMGGAVSVLSDELAVDP
jgi:hypothetical protein